MASVASAERVAVRSTGPNNGDGALGRDPDAGELMDVGSVPDAFATDDSPEQDAVIDAMKNIYTFPDGSSQFYEDIAARPCKLSDLKRWYNEGKQRRALQQLNRKYYIEVDDEFRVERNSPNATFMQAETYLDFEVSVGLQGMDALIPGPDTAVGFSCQLQFQPKAQWKITKAMLGTDVTGRMLRVGSSADTQVSYSRFTEDSCLTGNPLAVDPALPGGNCKRR